MMDPHKLFELYQTAVDVALIVVGVIVMVANRPKPAFEMTVSLGYNPGPGMRGELITFGVEPHTYRVTKVHGSTLTIRPYPNRRERLWLLVEAMAG